MEETVKLIECIITWQGELNSGRRVLLCRFKHCNKKCKWCDTIVKMRIQQESEYKISDLQNIINKEKVGLLITGGEPTYNSNFTDTLTMLNLRNLPFIDIESNGHRLLDLVSRIKSDKPIINCFYSPKIFTEKELVEEIDKSEKLAKIPNVYFKVVYEDRDLVKEYLEFIEELNINQRIFLMVKGTTREELFKNAPEVFDAAEKYKFNFSSRDHIIYNFI